MQSMQGMPRLRAQLYRGYGETSAHCRMDQMEGCRKGDPGRHRSGRETPAFPMWFSIRRHQNRSQQVEAAKASNYLRVPASWLTAWRGQRRKTQNHLTHASLYGPGNLPRGALARDTNALTTENTPSLDQPRIRFAEARQKAKELILWL